MTYFYQWVSNRINKQRNVTLVLKWVKFPYLVLLVVSPLFVENEYDVS